MSKAVTNQPSNRLSFHNPFPGLKPIGLPISEDKASPIVVFDENDRHLKNLMLKLSAYRFITMIGGANIGKSTMVYAGLLPRLRNGFEVNGKSTWKIATFIPRQNPIDELAHALVREDLQIKDSLKSDMLNILNESGSVGIIKAYEYLMANKENDRENLLIYVDQFDEFFQYYKRQKDALRNGQNDNAKISKLELNILKAQRFISQLLEACKQIEYPIYVLATMRSASLGETIVQFQGLPDMINQGQYVLSPPKEREIKKGILGPLESLDIDYEPGLVSSFWYDYINDKDIPLSLVQLAFMQAWNKRDKSKDENSLTVEDLKRVLGPGNANRIGDILNDTADKAFKNLEIGEGTRGGVGNKGKTHFEQELEYTSKQLVCRTVFRHLLQNSNARNGLIAVPFNNLVNLISNPDLTHLWPIKDAIADYKRLLMQNLATGDKEKEDELMKMTETSADPNWFTEEWKKDDIGRMVHEYSLENNARSVYFNDIENSVKAVVEEFREVSLLKVYGEIDLADNNEEEHQILHNSHVQITNDILLDREYGWKQLNEWQTYYDTTIETYRQLFVATKNWKEAMANGEKGENYLWSMPELGLAIKWIYHFKPSVDWLNRRDKEFQQSIGTKLVDKVTGEEQSINYHWAFIFLVESIKFYQRETIDKDQAQKEELKKTKRRLLFSIILATLAIIGVLVAIFFMFKAINAEKEADESRNQAVASREDASAFAKQALINEYEATKAQEEAVTALGIADSAKGVAESAEAEAIRQRENALRDKRRAEALKLIADSTKNEALKRQLLAKAAEIEAEAARILALLAEKESERLRNIEYIRRKSLDLAAMIDDGQLEAARDSIQRLYRDTVLQPLAKENREFYMALQKLFFNTDSLRERYSYSLPSAGGIRTIIPSPKRKSAFIVGGANGRLAYLETSLDQEKDELAKYSFAPIASNEHIRSMAMDPKASRLLVGTNEGALIGINWAKDTANWQPTYSESSSSKKKPFQLKRLYRERLEDTTIIRDLKYLNKDGKLLLQYYQMTNKDEDGNLQDSRFEDEVLTMPFPAGRTFNYKKTEKISLELPSYIKDSLRIDAISLTSNRLLIAGRITKQPKDSINLMLSSRVYFYDLENLTNTPSYIQIPPPNSKTDLNLARRPFITALAVSPDEGYLAIGKYNGDIYLFKDPFQSSKDSVFISNAHYSQISAFDFFQDNRKLNLAVASYDHTGSLIDVYDRFKQDNTSRQKGTNRYKDIFLMKIHQRWMYALKYTNGGKQILTISEDGTAKLWYTTVEDTYKRIFGTDESI